MDCDEAGRDVHYDEPLLPRLPPPESRPSALFANQRKRARFAPLTSTSSDPAIFSSDDDPALENIGRRKKKYFGSWECHQAPASSDSAIGDEPQTRPSQPTMKHKRTLRRQLDSGVYLEDVENSDLDFDACAEIEVTPARSIRSSIFGHPTSRAQPEVGGKKRTESMIQSYILTHVENGDETVDLSDAGLQTISNGTIAPLSSLVRIPTVVKDVEFEQTDPSIKLFLSKNLLISLPGAIFDIEHLTTLSVRSNKLTEIPPAIAKCKNLKSLNVSYNRLRSLPGELLDLLPPRGGLEELIVAGNSFWICPGFVLPDGQGTLQRRWRSPVQYSDTSGKVCSAYRFNFQTSEESVCSEQMNDNSSDLIVQQSEPLSRVPSLMELALQSASRASRDDVSLAAHLGPEAPDHLRRLLDAAAAVRYSGGQKCCRCGRSFIRPRTAWVEFYQLPSCMSAVPAGIPGATNFGGIIPFIRKGCSWRCLPEVEPDRVEGNPPTDQLSAVVI